MSGLGWKGGSASNALPPGPYGSRQRRSWPASPLIYPQVGNGCDMHRAGRLSQFGLGVFMVVLRGVHRNTLLAALTAESIGACACTRLASRAPTPSRAAAAASCRQYDGQLCSYLEGYVPIPSEFEVSTDLVRFKVHVRSATASHYQSGACGSTPSGMHLRNLGWILGDFTADPLRGVDISSNSGTS